MPIVTVTPLNSPYTVNLAGSENLQSDNIVVQTSGGSVSVVLPATSEVGAPDVSVVCLGGTASVSLAAGVIAVSHTGYLTSGFVSGTIASLSAGSYIGARAATPNYWLIE